MSVNQSARRGHPVYLFLDEVQNLQAWDGQVKALLDHHQCRAFLTGSSALRMQAAKDNLAGRITTIDLGPLHLAEIATLRNYGPLEPYQKQLDLTSWTNKGFWIGLSTYEGGIPLVLDRAFRDFSEWGAYPFCHATPDINWQRLSSYLTDVVVERTIEHDSATASEKGQKVILAEVFRQAMRYAGQAPKCSTLASELTDLLEEDVKPADVRGNLEFLQRCMLIRLIEPLQLRLKRQTAPCKICICDHSVRSAWLQEKVCFVSDASDAPAGVDQDIAGHVLESVLGYYLSTFEGISLRHFPQRPSEPEVDYIVPVGSMRIPIEVKYRTNAVTPANLAGLQAFTRKNAYNAPFGILVTRDEAGDQGNNIIAIPARNFLLLG
jgi:predicted AAA+ superfamily ATPase